MGVLGDCDKPASPEKTIPRLKSLLSKVGFSCSRPSSSSSLGSVRVEVVHLALFLTHGRETLFRVNTPSSGQKKERKEPLEEKLKNFTISVTGKELRWLRGPLSYLR